MTIEEKDGRDDRSEVKRSIPHPFSLACSGTGTVCLHQKSYECPPASYPKQHTVQQWAVVSESIRYTRKGDKNSGTKRTRRRQTANSAFGGH